MSAYAAMQVLPRGTLGAEEDAVSLRYNYGRIRATCILLRRKFTVAAAASVEIGDTHKCRRMLPSRL
jgi:hypothetical protein